MQSINTLSLAPDARDWLAGSRHARILHVFDHACNLINERGEVLSIVTQQIGNGPFNLVVEDDVLFSHHLNAQSPISTRANQLNLGDLTINTEKAKLWSPRPDWERLHSSRDNIFTQLSLLRGRWLPAQSNLDQHKGIASSHTVRRSVQGSASLAMTAITNYQSLTSILSSALAIADISSALTITSLLAGLGNGLTPAGDDFLLGAIYSAWSIHPPEISRVLAEEIANTAAPLTTSLSAAWLRSAGRGDAGVLWHEFFDALISADPVRIQQALDKILALGETSGADALAGFFGTFISWAELLISKTP